MFLCRGRHTRVRSVMCARKTGTLSASVRRVRGFSGVSAGVALQVVSTRNSVRLNLLEIHTLFFGLLNTLRLTVNKSVGSGNIDRQAGMLTSFYGEFNSLHVVHVHSPLFLHRCVLKQLTINFYFHSGLDLLRIYYQCCCTSLSSARVQFSCSTLA